jgi:hypothetical protein
MEVEHEFEQINSFAHPSTRRIVAVNTAHNVGTRARAKEASALEGSRVDKISSASRCHRRLSVNGLRLRIYGARSLDSGTATDRLLLTMIAAVGQAERKGHASALRKSPTNCRSASAYRVLSEQNCRKSGGGVITKQGRQMRLP